LQAEEEEEEKDRQDEGLAYGLHFRRLVDSARESVENFSVKMLQKTKASESSSFGVANEVVASSE
jgi:uncharacterized protein (DUF2132 family)